MTDAPIDPRVRNIMNTLAHAIDTLLNGEARGAARQNAFVLLVFPVGEENANYISNVADRADIIPVLKATLARFEGQTAEGKA